MEFPGNFSSLKEEMNLQNQGSWVTVTPLKPVPSKMPVVTGGESWLEKEGVSSNAATNNGGGFYSMGGNAAENERHRSDGSSSSSFNCTRSLNNNWEEAMAAASVDLGRNQQNHGNLLNFIDLTSAAGGAPRGENSRHPYSVISYPHIHAQQPAIHARKPATLSLPSQKMLLGGMIPFNADTYSPQIPPYGFPIPYNRPAHNLNSVSKTQFPPTPENSTQNEKVQNSQSLSKLMDFYKQINQEKRESSLQSMGSLLQFSHAPSEKNVQNERTQNCKSSSKLTGFGIDERVTQEKNQNGSLPSWGSSLQFAPVTPEKNAQNDQSPAMFIDFVLDERSNQEKNQGYSLQSCNSPGKDAVENCSNQGLSQSAAVHPSQFAPATPGKNAQMETKQNNQSPLIDLGTEEIANKEKNQGSFLSRVSPSNEVIEIYCDQGLAQSSVIHQSQLYEFPNPNKGEINVIDLNKTPQQKPRRKKHRPKVIREQKSAKTPKPMTPKQSGSKVNATGRKRNLEDQSHMHSKTPLPCAGEPDAAQTGRPQIPSCKRSLNFESETQAGDGGFGTSEICRSEVDNHEDVSEAANLQAVEAPQIENQSLGITLDLNSSMTQVPDIYLPSSQNPTLSSPLKRKTPSKENLKNMARKRSNMGIMSATVEYQDNRKAPTGTCIPQEMEPENIQISQVLQGSESLIESQLDSNTISQPLPTHTKPGCKELNQEQGHPVHNSAFHPSNLIEAHLVPMKTYLEMLQAFQYPGNGSNLNQHYPQIYKKERTKRPKNGTSKVVCDMSSFSMSVAQTHMVQKFPREDRAGIGFHKPQDYGSLPALSQIELKTKKRSNTPTRIRNMASFSASKCNQMLAINPNWTPGHDAKQGHGFSHGPQSCVEALVANNKSKMVKKKRTKKVSHTVSSTSFSPTNQVQARQDEIIIYCDRQCFIGSTSPPFGQKTTECNASSPRKLEMQVSHILPTNSVHDCGSSSNLHRIVAMVPLVDPIDEIVQRLKNLNINRGDETAETQTENALVPYVRDGTMVPYEGPFDPIKKRRSRPKVDLDMETLRQWKLLMGKDSSENLEGTDEEKEKWWEEERGVFRGRADSFIARMHLVQGDRRFSQWKGSVVDSVVGVFLTQNVSDHLSSSAFMSLAARFPLQSKTDSGTPNIDGTNIDPPEPDVCVLEFNNTMNWQDKVMVKQMPDQSSMTHHEAELGEENHIASSIESFGSTTLRSKANGPEGTHLAMCETGEKMCQQSTENRIDIPATATTGASLAEPEDRRSPEDVSASVVSSQNSTDSTAQIADRVPSSSESNSETEELITSCRSCSFDSRTSFMELLHMAGTRDFRKFYINENPILSSDEDFINAFDQCQSKGTEQRKSTAILDGLKCPCSSINQANSHVVHTQNKSIEDAGVFVVNYNLNQVELACPASGTTGLCSKASDVTEVDVQLKLPSPLHNIAAYHPDANINKPQSSQLLDAKQDATLEIDPKVSNDPPSKMTEPLSGNNTLQICSDLPVQNTTNLLCKAGEAAVQAKSTHVAGNGIHVEALAQNGNFITWQTNSSLVNYKGETLNTVGCSGLTDNLNHTERNIVESSSRNEVYSAEKTSVVETYDALKAKKRKGMAEIKKPVDWDSLRTQVIGNGAPKERSHVTMDSLDWEAVRCAEVGDIAHAIRERGMNNMLAERIKAFLNRMVTEHGSIDLEWLRDVPPDKAKDYLLSIRGLGLKSVECVRLLALQHLAFPVDTNVGRICVRLGWVPLQPLPESLQLHLLELYPVLESIQKYLWPRLCKLDQRTLYELHYQLITFGKVFCTKNRPNCNACPMRGECKHFASAFASARLALPGPEEKSLISSAAPIMIEPDNKLVINPRSPAALPPPEANTDVQEDHGINKCEPIIEEPATPEYIESSGTIEEIAIEETPYAIEDTPYEDPDEIPTIKLNLEELTLHVQNYIQENKMELQDADTSRALVTLTPEAASIPMPKLKNVNRLRTEHQVYELPDTHPLLEGLDPREPDDPCSYLLAIWTPGETAESIKPPELGCSSQASGNLCDKETCFSCNSIREANAETVRGTLLIPCRTAMRGSFPLNGTYFQVNEVFADHDSSLTPIDVPRAWIWNLPRRTVFFGTSIPTIFRGLTTEGIQYCFWRGFVCVRGFDRTKRAPRPLMARLHFPASKLTRSRKGPAKAED